MEIHDHIVLWNHAYCKIIDIRHVIMRPNESLYPYPVPASIFLMSVRGSAQLKLDGIEHNVRRFKIFHTGKGAVLDICAGQEGFEYYVIYYKANIPLPAGQEIMTLMDRVRPFHIQYGFMPAYPVALYGYLTEMYKDWEKTEPISRLRVKALLHQFVYELMNQMQLQGIRSEKRDLAAQIISIINHRYAEPITLESLSESLNYSVPHLSSYFKSRTGLSPIDYLIKIRMDKAAELLLETDATLKEIAAGVGYQDPYYLGRLFKKHNGLSPSHYRTEHSAIRRLEDNPSISMRSSIVSRKPLRYTDVGDNHYQSDGEEVPTMFNEAKPPMAVALLLSFMLLLSACGAAGNTAESTHTPVETEPVSSEQQTKIISTIAGEIEVPTHPKRVVAGEYLGSLIALGVIPVGTSNHHIQNPYFNDALKGVEDIGDGNGNIEKILEMEPDLIIMDDTYAEMNEQLPKIAPTVIVPFASLKTVHDELTYFGKLLGKEQEAEIWLADYDRRIAEAKVKVLKAIPADSTFSVMELMEKNISAVGSNYGKGGQAVYGGFGFKPPAEVDLEMKDPGWASISAETLPKYAGDYIILTTDSHTMEDLKADPIWNSLDAVKNDRVYIWGPERSWYWDPIAILTQTEELAEWLTGLK
ncbi:AraC family transcriptional regulator [Bacillus sp. FJAT-26390]|uniref:AraC family transcriptional regulator n=1 Tax=Bacillus sp. FJAT-26390 TaxID=1743142 RepID=UPI000807DA74|nr:AraC family transcriptional regulator [Bacillus sp. FJAT-26390]OBZ17091.1 AraC family transcriptional regulator [Bacillus sp. FJAT-26390]